VIYVHVLPELAIMIYEKFPLPGWCCAGAGKKDVISQ